MIKVEHTRWIDDMGLPNTNKLVADAELVLFPCIMEEAKLVSVRPNNALYLYTGKPINGDYLKQILISKTERPKTGDLVLDLKDNSIWNIQIQSSTDFKRYRKILALPEHFSPEQLQMIVDDKLKEGKCMVECENKIVGSGFSHIGRQPSSQERLRGCYDNGEQIIGEWKDISVSYIKLNPYITIYPVEESSSLTPLQDFYEWYREANAANRSDVLIELKTRLKTREQKIYTKEEIASWVDELHHLSSKSLLNGRSYSSGVFEAASLILSKLI